MTTRESDEARQLAEEIVRRQALRSSLEEWWERVEERSSTWDLETVKHLVVLNAAGFAGVATLLAGNKPLHPGWVGCAALLGYGFGVTLAILNMYLASVSFGRMIGEIKERIGKTHDLSEPMGTILDRLTAGTRLNIAGQVCGWFAAGLAVASTLALGVSLVR